MKKLNNNVKTIKILLVIILAASFLLPSLVTASVYSKYISIHHLQQLGNNKSLFQISTD